MFFAILDSFLYPLSQSHRTHVDKLATGFAQLGYRVIKVKTLQELQALSDKDILYLSNHFELVFKQKRISEYLLLRILYSINKGKPRLLLWSFHHFSDLLNRFDFNCLYLFDPCSKLTFTGHIKNKSIYMKYSSFVDPLSMNNLPHLPLSHRPSSIYYVGSRYNHQLCSELKARYADSFIHEYPPFLNTIMQWNQLSLSRISVCLFSPAHVDAGSFTERLPESLSAGNIIIHNHPNLPNWVNSIESVFAVSGSLKSFISMIDYILKMSDCKINELGHASLCAYQANSLSYKDFAAQILKRFSDPSFNFT